MAKNAATKAKNLLIKGGPVFDIAVPTLGGLWITLSFIPVVLSFISQGAIPPETLIGAMVCSELAIILPRELTPVLSWFSDTFGLQRVAKDNTQTANRLRKIQLALGFISILMFAVGHLQTLSEGIASFWHMAQPVLQSISQNTIIAGLIQVCSYAPYVSAAAGVLGAVYYSYQAYQAAKKVTAVQEELNHLNLKHNEFRRLYRKIHRPNADINALTSGLTKAQHKDFMQYVETRHKLEADLRTHKNTRNANIFFAALAGLSVLIALTAIAATFPPVGAVVVGAVTLAVAIKITIAVASFLIAAATIGFYINKGVQTYKEKQLVAANNSIENELATRPAHKSRAARLPEKNPAEKEPARQRVNSPVNVSKQGMFKFTAKPKATPAPKVTSSARELLPEVIQNKPRVRGLSRG